MKSVFLILIFSISDPVCAFQNILGEFSTVIGSECVSEIHFFKNGKGTFIDSCRGGGDDIYKTTFSWDKKNNTIHAVINGINETFTFRNKLSCSYFGEKGNSNGLVGFDLYFWRKPIQCK